MSAAAGLLGPPGFDLGFDRQLRGVCLCVCVCVCVCARARDYACVGVRERLNVFCARRECLRPGTRQASGQAERRLPGGPLQLYRWRPTGSQGLGLPSLQQLRT